MAHFKATKSYGPKSTCDRKHKPTRIINSKPFSPDAKYPANRISRFFSSSLNLFRSCQHSKQKLIKSKKQSQEVRAGDKKHCKTKAYDFYAIDKLNRKSLEEKSINCWHSRANRTNLTFRIENYCPHLNFLGYIKSVANRLINTQFSPYKTIGKLGKKLNPYGKPKKETFRKIKSSPTNSLLCNFLRNSINGVQFRSFKLKFASFYRNCRLNFKKLLNCSELYFKNYVNKTIRIVMKAMNVIAAGRKIRLRGISTLHLQNFCNNNKTFSLQDFDNYILGKLFCMLPPKDVLSLSIVSKRLALLSNMPCSWEIFSETMFDRTLRNPDVYKLYKRFTYVKKIGINIFKSQSQIYVDTLSFDALLENLHKLSEIRIIFWNGLHADEDICKIAYSRIFNFLERLIENNSYTLMRLIINNNGLSTVPCLFHKRLCLPKVLPNLEYLQLSIPFTVPEHFQINKCSSISLKELHLLPPKEYLKNIKIIFTSISKCTESIEISGNDRACCLDTEIQFPNLRRLYLGWTNIEELTLLNKLVFSHYPKLRKLFLNGPRNTGLTDLHLDIYTKLNHLSPFGVYFKYDCFNLSFQSLVKFRCSLQNHGLFALFTTDDLLHHLNIQNYKQEIDINGSPLKIRKDSWSQAFKYDFVLPQKYHSRHATRSKFVNCEKRITQRLFPIVGRGMMGFDLFCLEMSMAPEICCDLDDDISLEELWNLLPLEAKVSYEGPILHAYIKARTRVFDWRFKNIRPWWETKRQGNCDFFSL